MTAFVLAGLAGGIGAAIGARMARRSAILAILGLSFGHLTAQSAHDPACRLVRHDTVRRSS
jgi:hypothetical protein